MAGRSKDLNFLHHLIQGGYVEAATLRDRLAISLLDREIDAIVHGRLKRLLMAG